jgi:succinate dehydrogenase/fumarate reductase flavoprotein subunit
MKNENAKTNYISCDVLIVGAGLAGLTAATKIKMLNEKIDVVLVEKGGIGWSGAVPIGGGHLMILQPDENLDDWVKWVVDRGNGLCNIDWLYQFGGSLYESAMELFNWGLPFMKDPDGKIHITPGTVRTWKTKESLTAWVTHKALLHLKKMALAKGVKMFDKVETVDLLKHNGHIGGAVGFDIITGDFDVFKAKATLIATSSICYKNRRFWSMNGGEMVAASYRAGAEQIQAEFGTLHSHCSKEVTMWFRGKGVQDSFVNALGEPIMTKYFPDISESFWKAAYSIYSEVLAGRGPIYFDMSNKSEDEVIVDIYYWNFSHGAFWNPPRLVQDKLGIDLRSEKVEWVPGFLGALGSISVDLNCKSPDLDGLWAVGSAIRSSVALEGAAPYGDYGGWGLPFAYVSGLKASASIVKSLAQLPEPRIGDEEVNRLREEIYAPMALEKGFEPYEAIFKIQQAIVPAKYSIIKEGSRIKEALGILDEVKEMLPKVKAENPHQLVRYHEARAMALGAEMTQRASLFRTETRGAHIREDCPETDDKNWLKWTAIKKDGENMVISTHPVPKK